MNSNYDNWLFDVFKNKNFKNSWKSHTKNIILIKKSRIKKKNSIQEAENTLVST